MKMDTKNKSECTRNLNNTQYCPTNPPEFYGNQKYIYLQP